MVAVQDPTTENLTRTLEEVVAQVNAIEQRMQFLLALLPIDQHLPTLIAAYSETGLPLVRRGDCISVDLVQQQYAKAGQILRVLTHVHGDYSCLEYSIDD